VPSTNLSVASISLTTSSSPSKDSNEHAEDPGFSANTATIFLSLKVKMVDVG